MHPRLTKQPIHLGALNKGKLRKVQYHKKEKRQTSVDLTITPHQIVREQKSQRKQRKQNLFRKIQDRILFTYQNDTQASKTHTRQFRTIHTANSNQIGQRQSKGQVSPFTTFQNTFRLSRLLSKRKNRSVQAKFSKNQQKYSTIQSLQRSKRQNDIDKYFFYEQNCTFLDEQSKQIQQFYRYKHKDQMKLNNTVQDQHFQQISGFRISPFQRRQIREIYEVQYQNKVKKYDFKLNQ